MNGGLTKKELKALKSFKQELEKVFPDRVSELKVFGSKARGDAHKFSDVDVLVVLEGGDWRDRSKVHSVATQIFLDTDVDLSSKIFTSEAAQTLREHGSPLLHNIDKEGVEV